MTTDRYTGFVSSGFGRTLSRRLGLPQPVELRRFEPGQPLLDGPLGLWGNDQPLDVVTDLAEAEGLQVAGDGDTRLAAIVYDACGATDPASLELFATTIGPALKRLRPSGRVVVLGRPPESIDDPARAAAQRALEGVVRSIGKELRAGATANLVLVEAGAEARAESALRFLLSSRSAYVDGQVIRVGPAVLPATDWQHPLQGKVAVVTGAARGIGAAIADVLARDGATVVAVDVPAAGEALATVANRVGGTALQVDVTAPDAGRRIADHAHARHGGLDVMVHNAGITRDKLLVNTDADRWNSVIAVNLESQLRIDDVLLGEGGLADSGRVVCLSSTSGLAGNRGQANYAASKAGVIGMVQARARQVADRGITYNAVAPGFIETVLTARIPLATREVGRRINSLSQGGLPVDVAETVAWFAQPGSAGVSGQVLRVCGQSQLGGVTQVRTITLDDDPNLLALTARGAVGRSRPDVLPDVELVRSDVRASAASLAAYSRVCGFAVDGQLPTTYLHVLAFPLQTALMGRPDFPFALPGLVHVANRLELRRPVGFDESLGLAVRAADLRPHPRGRQVDLHSEATVDGEVVWRGRSTYLAKQASSAPSERGPRPTSAATGPPDARWRLPGDLGRRYAAVSGDHNPIHLNPLAARAFGFPRTIAHGMWSLARCVSSLAGWGPATGVVEVEYRRPVLLPSTVELRTERVDGGWDLLLSARGRHGAEPTEHLRGTVRAL